MSAAKDDTSNSLVSLMDKLCITKYDVESSHWVYVTHINQPDNFYVTPTAYTTFLKKLETPGGPLEPSRLGPRTIVTFESETKSRFIRGRICDILENNVQALCRVFALDYGFMEVVSVANLRSNKHDLIPGLAILCQLADCYPKGKEFSKEAKEAMVEYLNNERVKIIVKAKSSEKLTVQVINSCPEDISTMLALTGFSTLGFGDNVVSRMPKMEQPKLYYTYKQLKVGDTLKVRVQSGDTLDSFYVCDVRDYADHPARYDDFWMCLKHEKNIPEDSLAVGMPVAVHNGVRFERAIITALGPNRPVAQLVDSGKTMQLTADSRPRALNREYYFESPAIAIYCSTQDNSWNNGLPKFLYPGYVFMIKIAKLAKDFKTPNIVNLIKV